MPSYCPRCGDMMLSSRWCSRCEVETVPAGGNAVTEEPINTSKLQQQQLQEQLLQQQIQQQLQQHGSNRYLPKAYSSTNNIDNTTSRISGLKVSSGTPTSSSVKWTTAQGLEKPLDRVESSSVTTTERKVPDSQGLTENMAQVESNPERKYETATAIYDFEPQEKSQLRLTMGETVTVIQKDPDGWWLVEKGGVRGLVPGTFARIKNSTKLVTTTSPISELEAIFSKNSSITNIQRNDNTNKSYIERGIQPSTIATSGVSGVNVNQRNDNTSRPYIEGIHSYNMTTSVSGVNQTTSPSPIGVNKTTPSSGVNQTTPSSGVNQTTPSSGVIKTTPSSGVIKTTSPNGVNGVNGVSGRQTTKKTEISHKSWKETSTNLENTSGSSSSLRRCCVCNEAIIGPKMEIDNKAYHEFCFVCGKCGEVIEEDEKHAIKMSKPYHLDCIRDSKACDVCQLPISARLYHNQGKFYHNSCFKCSSCNRELSEGNFISNEGVLCCNLCSQQKSFTNSGSKLQSTVKDTSRNSPSYLQVNRDTGDKHSNVSLHTLSSQQSNKISVGNSPSRSTKTTSNIQQSNVSPTTSSSSQDQQFSIANEEQMNQSSFESITTLSPNQSFPAKQDFSRTQPSHQISESKPESKQYFPTSYPNNTHPTNIQQSQNTYDVYGSNQGFVNQQQDAVPTQQQSYISPQSYTSKQTSINHLSPHPTQQPQQSQQQSFNQEHDAAPTQQQSYISPQSYTSKQTSISHLSPHPTQQPQQPQQSQQSQQSQQQLFNQEHDAASTQQQTYISPQSYTSKQTSINRLSPHPTQQPTQQSQQQSFNQQHDAAPTQQQSYIPPQSYTSKQTSINRLSSHPTQQPQQQSFNQEHDATPTQQQSYISSPSYTSKQASINRLSPHPTHQQSNTVHETYESQQKPATEKNNLSSQFVAGEQHFSNQGSSESKQSSSQVEKMTKAEHSKQNGVSLPTQNSQFNSPVSSRESFYNAPSSAISEDEISAIKIAVESGKELCGGCKKVLDGQIIGALDALYHESCFRCFHCNSTISGENGYAEKDNHPYHQNCYEELFGKKCCKCKKLMKGKIVKALGELYHPECFNCAKCSSLLVGSFFEYDGMAVCESCRTSLSSQGQQSSTPDQGSESLFGMATALYDFKPQAQGQIPLTKGDLVTIVTKDFDGWSMVKKSGMQGLVPSLFLKLESSVEKGFCSKCVFKNPEIAKFCLQCGGAV